MSIAVSSGELVKGEGLGLLELELVELEEPEPPEPVELLEDEEPEEPLDSNNIMMIMTNMPIVNIFFPVVIICHYTIAGQILQ